MAYSSIDDIKKQLSEDELLRLTDDRATGLIDESRIETAIETADIEIDAYLANRYALPLAEVPAILGKLSVDLAVCNLYLLSPGGVPEHREKQASGARSMLVSISQGKLEIIPTVPDQVSEETVIVSSERIFSRTKMGGF